MGSPMLCLFVCVWGLASSGVHAYGSAAAAMEAADGMAKAGNTAAAIEILEAAAMDFPKDMFIHSDLGFLLGEEGRLSDAARAFQAAIALGGDHPALSQLWFNLGFTHHRGGDAPTALAAFKQSVATAASPSDAMQPLIKCAFISKQMGDLSATVGFLQRALEIAPGEGSLWGYLGETLNNLKRWNEAVAAYTKAVDADPRNGELRLQLGDTLMNMGRLKDAAKQFKTATKYAPRLAPLHVSRFAALRQLSFWLKDDDNMARVVTATQKSLGNGVYSPLPPYQAMFLALPRGLRRDITSSWGRQYIGDAKQARGGSLEPLYRAAGAQPTALTLGFVSRRFERYPGTQLMLRLFAALDRTNLSVVCVATGPDDHSMERRTVAADCDTFVDASSLDARATAGAIADLHVDVLLDYDGFHDFNNMVALAMRPARRQLTWLGFAATTGDSGIVDGAVVDAVIAPVEVAGDEFGEKLVYLPTYQPQNPTEEFALEGVSGVLRDVHAAGGDMSAPPSVAAWRQATRPMREAAGLPGDAVVLAVMNRNSKIDPTVFGVWMRILHAVPAAVLWLYAPNSDAQGFLHGAAREWGVSPTRILFMDKVPKPQHLARHYAADLLLDTLEYGAHTTAADALSTGMPIVSLQGSSFASRVASGLVAAAGLPTVTHSLRGYEDVTVRLARQPGVLLAMRHQVLRRLFPRGRHVGSECPDVAAVTLFSPPCFARHMEAAVTAVHDVRDAPMHVVAVGGTRGRRDTQ